MREYLSGMVPGIFALGVLVSACTPPEEAQDPAAAARSLITEELLAAHIETLASDEFGGRAPFSIGERLTINYIADKFEALGLEPGNGDDYFQRVPLVSIAADPETSIAIRDASGAEIADYVYGDDMMIWTTRVEPMAEISASDLVFVGYGINAPEYGWNDYEGLDVTGKTVVILVNDPGYATKDPDLFNGHSMTYYGRWTYKYEEAARQGAAGALIIHDDGPAGYPWAVVSGSWAGPQFDLIRSDRNASRVAIEGWLTMESAINLFEAAGLDLVSLSKAAGTAGFKAVPMGLNATARVDNLLLQSLSHNVVAVLPGSERPDEYFIYMAHWDHLGRDPDLEGDQIYNGALDNASGTAALLALAEAFASLETAPARSIIFLAVTAEEQGLLGSAYYASNPLFSLNQTVAGLNMDGLNDFGPTRDIVVTGYGASELDAIMEARSAALERRVDPDPEPEKGYYYRSDHFELAKRGVPMIYPGSGIDHVTKGVEFGMAQAAAYLADRYHKPADEFDESWVLSGGVADVQLYFDFGLSVAMSDNWPNWHEGNEFRAIRDASMEGAGE